MQVHALLSPGHITSLDFVQNPSSYLFERSMARMALDPEAPPAKSCTWDYFCHVWKDALVAEQHSRTMLEKAFPVRPPTWTLNTVSHESFVIIVSAKCFDVQFFDSDGSGFITRQEMMEQFQELGGLLTANDIQRFFDILDSDGNGVIDVSDCTVSSSVAQLWSY
jgi:hypothetical protein